MEPSASSKVGTGVLESGCSRLKFDPGPAIFTRCQTSWEATLYDAPLSNRQICSMSLIWIMAMGTEAETTRAALRALSEGALNTGVLVWPEIRSDSCFRIWALLTAESEGFPSQTSSVESN